MNSYNSYKWAVLIVQLFTVLMLIFAIIADNNMTAKRHENDTTSQLEKFRNKFHDTRTASDPTFEDVFVNGFVNHMQAINRAVLKAEDAYHQQMLAIFYGLIIMNLFALVVSIKENSVHCQKRN